MYIIAPQNFPVYVLASTLLIIHLILSPTHLLAQDPGYIFPIKPFQKNHLSGSMGELRSNHFHAGIDIKTEGIEGLPVYAIDSGYVSRIKISTSGYGNALYIKHPNGQTSVYAHLSRFRDDIARYVKGAQYEKQKFEVGLFPEPGELTVAKKDIIAYSGNTGGSLGPHLHFEIRDKNQHVINPLKHKFDELDDTMPPEVYRMAIKSLNHQSRVDHQFGRFEYHIYRKGSNYFLKNPVTAFGKIGIQIQANDRMNGTYNHNGVQEIKMWVNDSLAFHQDIETFSFAQTKYIAVHTDYEIEATFRRRFHKLYLDDGNQLDFYKAGYDGHLNIVPDSTYSIKIDLLDSWGNESQMNFTVQGKSPEGSLSGKPVLYENEGPLKLIDNTLKFVVDKAQNDQHRAEVFSNNKVYNLPPAYSFPEHDVFLWDMREGLPDSIKASSFGTKHLNYKALVPPKHNFSFSNGFMDISFPRNSLFDTLYLTTSYEYDVKANREIFSISKAIFPLAGNITIDLKPSRFYEHKDKVAAYYISGNNPDYEGGYWEDNQFSIRTRHLGDFTLLADTVKPQVNPLIINKNKVKFRINDELSGIASYDAYINGEWVLMAYEPKKNMIWSEKWDEGIPFSGDFELHVEDNMGNKTIYTTKFN